MAGSLRQRIAVVNGRVALMLKECGRALRGERNFGLEDVRAISLPVSEMAPIMANAQKLRCQEPEIEEELAIYKKQLAELHTALEQVRMMLIARRGRVEEARTHMDSVSRWAAATKLIR
jgi:hypothetical protein